MGPKGRLRRLLTHGCLPAEVPPCFTTGPFGRVLTTRGVAIPTEMTPGPDEGRDPRPLARHNLARVGQLRRPLGIPHPARYYALAREIARNWQILEHTWLAGCLSVSQPVMDSSIGRAVARRLGPPDMARLRAHHRRSARYLLVADVLQCYPSIYTHSIAWAVETKPRAKAQRFDPILGNRLDRRTMQLQEGQTRGIPIGPDTSTVLSELVLAAVDQELIDQIGCDVSGFRMVDDYELAFSSISQAEEALAALQSALSAYELQVNERKTQILELPAPLEEPWPRVLREMPLRDGPKRQIRDLLSLFSVAFELASDHRQAPVLRYAIARCRREDLEPQSWPVYQQLLLQCALLEVGALRYVAAELRTRRDEGHEVSGDLVQDVVSKIIGRHVPLGHGNEVAWAIWLTVLLNVPLAKDAVELIPDLDDPLVPVLALYAEERGLTAATLDRARWDEHARPDALDGDYWLLSYEAIRRGWLQGGSMNLHGHPVFRFLQDHDVTFLNVRASTKKIRPWRRRLTDAQLIGYDL